MEALSIGNKSNCPLNEVCSCFCELSMKKALRNVAISAIFVALLFTKQELYFDCSFTGEALGGTKK